jgi:uncharacterized membrane protein HdeD (DUF308 family)
MKASIFWGALVAAGAAAPAHAANLAVITSPPTMLHVVVLFFAVACTAGSVRVISLVRGGRMSKSWQMFLGGFLVLALAQIILLCETFEVLTLPGFVVPTALVVMAGLFLFGIVETKRTLS